VRHPVARSRNLTVPAVIAAAVAALLLSVGPSYAGTGYGQLIVNPGTAAQGQTVAILGVCPTNGDVLKGVRSTAFVGGVAAISLGSENFTGTATISPAAAPGTYSVSADCGPGSPSVTITVSAGGVAPTARPPATQPATTPTPPPVPVPVMASATSPSAQQTTAMNQVGRTGVAALAGGGSPGPSTAAALPQDAMSAAAGGMQSPAAASGPAVTSTGVVRVGLAGDSGPSLSTPTAAASLAVLAAAGGAGFLLIRRRRSSPTTHS
jgi:hypothetical protein